MFCFVVVFHIQPSPKQRTIVYLIIFVQRENSLFTRVIDKSMFFVVVGLFYFLHPASAETKDYCISNYFCTERHTERDFLIN